MKLYHTWISHLFSLKFLVLVVLDLCLPMPLCNLLALEVTTILSGKCFWSSYNFTSSVLMTTYAHILVSIDLVRIGYGIGRRLQYGWVWFILLSSTEQDIKHKEKFMAQNLEGPSHSCSCCKHEMHWQVETYDALHISTPTMLWKVIANKSCVVVCKSNGQDDIMFIWELDDEPQCTFQISKAKHTFNYGQICYSLPLVGVNHLFFQPLQPSNIILTFFPPNVTSVIQPLDQGGITSFKVQYKKKLLD